MNFLDSGPTLQAQYTCRMLVGGPGGPGVAAEPFVDLKGSGCNGSCAEAGGGVQSCCCNIDGEPCACAAAEAGGVALGKEVVFFWSTAGWDTGPLFASGMPIEAAEAAATATFAT